MTSSTVGSPLSVWSGEVLHTQHHTAEMGGPHELRLSLHRPTTEDVVVLIVHLEHRPPVRAGDHVRVVGHVLPMPAWEPTAEEPNPPQRVRYVAGIRVHRRRWASAWSQWRRRRVQRSRERQLGLR